jgi:ComF family protein
VRSDITPKVKSINADIVNVHGHLLKQMSGQLRNLGSSLLERLPSQCLVCRNWPQRNLCDDCVSQFAQPQTRCTGCALPLPAGLRRCGQCLKTPPPLDQCLAAVSYGFPWSDLIADFKFRDHPALAKTFAALMLAAPWVEPALEQADVLLPIPLSTQRLKERGYNQAHWLAKALSPGKVQPNWLLRIQDSPAQHQLKRAERLHALDHAFALDPLHSARIKGLRVLVVDDVMTTGASLHAAAKVLRAAGASHITGLVFARTE